MSKSNRFHRHLDRLGWLDRGGEGEDQIEKRWPGNKAWARFLASLTASLIVAGFRIFESYLRFVFAMLEEGPMGLAILVASHIALIAFILTQLF